MSRAIQGRRGMDPLECVKMAADKFLSRGVTFARRPPPGGTLSEEWWGWGVWRVVPSLTAGRRSHHTSGADQFGLLAAWRSQSHGDGREGERCSWGSH
jgi:hypothetical protein